MTFKGRKCEITKISQDENRGCVIIPTGIGSDYARFCPSEKPTLVEVKKGCGSLTPTQKRTKSIVQHLGWNYAIERCNCKK